MSKVCRNCGAVDSIELDRTTSSSDLICTVCGVVQEENRIVSEVQFGESASGAAMVQGSMVRLDQARPTFSGRQNAMESREQTLAAGQSKIRKLAQAMRINDHVARAAGGWFKLALTQNFVQGRRSQNVVAVCLYVACRKENTHHMLIDFSARLQISVFSLGATYLKMVKALSITNLPLADPSIFIQHFAERLEFGSKTKRVVQDASKLVKRMANDWIHEGRRPAGIAGACLLLAARMNNFRRTHEEIVDVSHVAPETLQRRLNEFSKTTSGDMSVSQFLLSESAAPGLPPSFRHNRKLEEKLLARLKERQQALDTFKELAEKGELIPQEVPEILKPAQGEDDEDEQDKEMMREMERISNRESIKALKELFSQHKAGPIPAPDSDSDEYATAALEAEDEEMPASKEVLEDGQTSPQEAKQTRRSRRLQILQEIRSTRPETPQQDDFSDEEASESFRSTPESENTPELEKTPVRAKATGRLGRLETDLERILKKLPRKHKLGNRISNQLSTKQKQGRATTQDRIERENAVFQLVLIDGVLLADQITKELDRIMRNQKKAIHELVYKTPYEEKNKSLDGDFEEQLKADRPVNLVENLPKTAELLEKVSSDVTIGPDDDDDEVDGFVLSAEDAAQKTRIWTGLNYDYILEQEKKKLKEEADIITGNTSGTRKKRKISKADIKDGDEIALSLSALGGANQVGMEETTSASAAESAKRMAKRLSKKINYESIEDLFHGSLN